MPLFGKYRYEPAVPNLVDSLSAACLNIGFAALISLAEIYPEAEPPETLNEAFEFWRGYPISSVEGDSLGAEGDGEP